MARDMPLLLLTLLLVACDDDSGQMTARDAAAAAAVDAATDDATDLDWSALVAAGAWTDAPPQDDPLSGHQPDAIECDIAGWFVENGELEVNTSRCNYLALTQPSLTAVEPGDVINLQLRHFDLTAPEPASAHVALLFGDDVVWELDVPIPGAAQVLDVEWTAQGALPEGSPVGLHLHNHGQNTWTLAHVRTRR